MGSYPWKARVSRTRARSRSQLQPSALYLGALLGGPVGRFLIEKNNLKPSADSETMRLGKDSEAVSTITEKSLTAASYQVLLTIAIGTLISYLLKKTGIEFPASVGAMTAAAIFRNIADNNEKLELKLPELAIISNISLLIFLALSMMTMKLWRLVDLALPLLLLLVSSDYFNGCICDLRYLSSHGQKL